jgi:hypothetical protein
MSQAYGRSFSGRRGFEGKLCAGLYAGNVHAVLFWVFVLHTKQKSAETETQRTKQSEGST